MKKHILVLLVATISHFAVAQNWIEYSNQEFDFEVLFPQEPTYSKESIKTEMGELVTHMFMQNSAESTISLNPFYSVVITVYPDDAIKNGPADFVKSTLDGTVSAMANSVRGKIIYDNIIGIKGFPGRHVKIALDGAFIYMQIYLIENRLYMTQIMALLEHEDNNEISKFQDSFKLNF